MEFKISQHIKSHIPSLSKNEYEILKENIKEYGGCRDPLVVGNIKSEDQSYLLDGHHRYHICEDLGEGYSYILKTIDFDTLEDAIAWVEDNQLGRRNLTPDQFRYYLGRKYERSKKEGFKGNQWTENASGQNDHQQKTAERIADEHGTTEKTVRRAADYANSLDTVAEVAGNDFRESVLSGEGNLTTKEIEELAESKDEIEQEGLQFSSEKEAEEWLRNKKKREQEERKAKRREKIKEMSEPYPEISVDKKYPVIYCDPPWKYEFTEADNRAIENQYPTMTKEEIKNLDIESVAFEDCVLFMWTTSPKLKDGLDIIEHWGFNYKTCAIWDKQKVGMGYYFRQQHELLLVATKGSIPPPDPSNRVSSIVKSGREEHSQKPEEVYEIIENMYPDLQKIELFARNERSGWDVWGNEI